MVNQVCFSSTNFSVMTTFVCLLIGFLVYISVYQIYKISEGFRISVSDSFGQLSKLFKYQKQEHILTPSTQVSQPLTESPNVSREQIRNNIYDPLVPPNRLYPGGKLNNINRFDNYQMIGFIAPVASPNMRYPLFGRYKYSGRSDRWEYYIIDESRNRIKIPIKTKNDNELYDGDTTFISELNEEVQITLYKFNDFDYRDIIY